MDTPTFFSGPEEFRAWLAAHHLEAIEVLVGFHKTHTGLPSLTWPESVDEALCFGWIDGLRKSLGETSYTIRFTKRKLKSTWSAINLTRVPELIAEGRMSEAGLKAWENRVHSKHYDYTYDGPDRLLGDAEEAEFRRNEHAWSYFQSQAPFYRKGASYWVMSAKREETRTKRLRTLIEDSAQGRRLERSTKYSGKRP